MSEVNHFPSEKLCSELVHSSIANTRKCGLRAKWKTPTGGFVCGHHRTRVDLYYASAASRGNHAKCEPI
jgi:hypothetical protein